MGLEVGDFIDDLVETNPTGLDVKSQGDDHLRLIKHVLKSTFPNFSGAFPFAQDVLPSPLTIGNYIRAVSAAAFEQRTAAQTVTDLDVPGLGLANTFTATNIFQSAITRFGSNALASDMQIFINALAGFERRLVFQSAGVTRAELGINTIAEGGANAGSNIYLRGRDDAATNLWTWIWQRASGQLQSDMAAGFSVSPATPAYSFSGDGDTGMYRVGADTIGMAGGGEEIARFIRTGSIHQIRVGDGSKAAAVDINGASGTQRQVRFQTAGGLRLEIGIDSTVEGGSADGSNFNIVGRDNAAAVLWTTQILRSTGQLRLANSNLVGAPDYSFSGDTDTGFRRTAANSAGIGTGGVDRAIFDGSGGVTGEGLESGTYSPTVTGLANIAVVTGGTWHYFRIGKFVMVYGGVNVDPTAAAALTRFRATLPVTPANFTNTTQAWGQGSDPSAATVGNSLGWTCFSESGAATVTFETALITAATSRFVPLSFSYRL